MPLAGAHESKERNLAPLATNLISYSSHSEVTKEWAYYVPAVPATAGAATQWGVRHGPVTKDAIRELHAKGAIALDTLFEADGMTEPKPLFAIRELRWWLSNGPGEP